VNPDTSPIKLIKLDCGLHYGKGGACRKCGSGITARDIAWQRDRSIVSAIRPAGESWEDFQAAIRNNPTI